MDQTAACDSLFFLCGPLLFLPSQIVLESQIATSEEEV